MFGDFIWDGSPGGAVSVWPYLQSLFTFFLKMTAGGLLFSDVHEIYSDPSTNFVNVSSFLTITYFSQYVELSPCIH